MIRSIIISLAFVSFIGLSADAQGYRGKKISIAYQPSYSMVVPPYGFDKMLMYNRVSFGYAISKHLTLNLSGQYGRTKEKYWDSRGGYDYENFGINDITGGISILYFRKFHQNYAPIGRYMGLGFEYGVQNGARIIEETTVDQWGYETTDSKYFYDSELRTTLMVISAHFGRNFLVKEKFLLGWGIQYGYTFGDKLEQNPRWRMGIKPNFTFGIIF